ncbi:MAG: hypothetical protein U9N45_07270 [Gemmatimonadota bacterium]|nr:hypothetical protein [Gemmatimonadota bacterium]
MTSFLKNFLWNSMMVSLLSGLLAALSPVPAISAGQGGKTFNFLVVSRDIGQFRELAEVACALKPYGRVELNVSSVADKNWFAIPEFRSPWHEYASYNPTIFRFFPHPEIAPFIPAETVLNNQQLLRDKVAILREHGLGASFWYYGVNYLPEEFFRQHPHLRGPRVDHPRRSNQEAFAMCVDQDESLEIYRWAMAELVRNVPELGTVVFKTNDAGSGLCWAAAQYSGPNGPRHCRNRTVGERLRDYCNTLSRGAADSGGEINIMVTSSNFWRNEENVLIPMLPDNAHYDKRDEDFLTIATSLGEVYPARGVVNPLDVLQSMESYNHRNPSQVRLYLRASYDRANETPYVTAKLVELMIDCIENPAEPGYLGRIEKLKEVAARWGGPENATALAEAFIMMDEAFSLQGAVAPRYDGLNGGVSMRFINRPLVFAPELLSDGEEDYFLPHVFNIRENEARTDYADRHGGRTYGPERWDDRALSGAVRLALSAARTFENCEGAPEEKWLGEMATALKIWASFIRSNNNFYHAQKIRDRYADIIAGPIRIPAKVASWQGDPGILEWNEIMRDEFDNTNELITILEKGGLELMWLATDDRHEDTFMLGPDLINQLRKKTRIMRAHWLDVENWLASPHK